MFCSLKSADILRRDRAGYPMYVELAAKNHAVEAIEVSNQSHVMACLGQNKITRMHDIVFLHARIQDDTL